MSYLKLPDETARAYLASNLAHLISSITTCVYHYPPRREGLWALEQFICSVITASRSKVSAILTALVYLNRVKSRINPGLFGKTSVRERIFVAALVLGTKYTNDSSPPVRGWSRAVRTLTPREINNAELQLLHALEWDLSVTEESILEQSSCIYGEIPQCEGTTSRSKGCSTHGCAVYANCME